tara:strand:+ start:3166 stop:3903 length:738 start_codon:yes stop_codon:yes gene_type:complete
MTFGKGYIERSYTDVPEFSAYPEFSGARVPRSQWRERIKYLNHLKIQPYHWHKHEQPVMNQKAWPYCWAYGTVGAVKTAYTIQGVGHVDLNAFALAYKIKGGRRQGGFAVEACKGVEKFGIPTHKYLPEFTKTNNWSDKVKREASRHKLVEFEELGRRDFDGVVSALIGERPSPVTLAFSWWKHLVLGLGVTMNRSGNVGLIIANSWGTGWSGGGLKGGYGIIWGDKAVPFESVAIRAVKSREES